MAVQAENRTFNGIESRKSMAYWVNYEKFRETETLSMWHEISENEFRKGEEDY